MGATLSKPAETSELTDYNIEFGMMTNYEAIPALQKTLNDLFIRLNKPQKNLPALIAEIKKQIVKYPDVLPFRNYLFSAYRLAGEDEKAKEVNEKTLAEHPDYLIGIINKAAEYLNNGEYDQIPEVLGPALEIRALQPERKKFHISEFVGFNKMVILYSCAVGNIEMAKTRFEMIKKFVTDEEETEEMEEAIEEAEADFEWNSKWQAGEQEDLINRLREEYLSLPQTGDMPVFNHAEIGQLYYHSLRIDPAIVHQILSLPRATLILDLQEVIYDSIRRFKHYEAGKAEEATRCFPLHAMTMLAQLKATESLPVLLEILRQGDDYLDYWFGDMLTEDIWQIYYVLFDLKEYVEYLQQPRLYSFAKTVISDTLFQRVANGELSGEEATATYQALLDFFINNRENADILDYTFNACLVCDVCNLKLTQLLPMVKTCFDYEMIDESVSGAYKYLERDSYKTGLSRKRRVTLVEGFEKFYVETMRGYSAYEKDEITDIDEIADISEDTEEIVFSEYREIAPKSNSEPEPVYEIPKKNTVGRNDPCPCGSGKKFKKCCMN